MVRGAPLHSDQMPIALHDGTITRARAIVRLLPQHRWNNSFLEKLVGVPGDEKSISLRQIDSEPNPHQHAASEYPEEQEEGHLAAKKRFKITAEVISKYGRTDGCPKCNLIGRGETDGPEV